MATGYWNNRYKKKLSPEQRAIQEGWRSGFEPALAENLCVREIGHLFEAGKIQYTVPARKATYTPDFFVRRDRGIVQPLPKLWYKSQEWWDDHFVIESKGQFTSDDRKKHLLIKDQYPNSDIRFVFDRKVRKDGSLGAGSGSVSLLRKGAKTTYGMWCDKNGFTYADNKVLDTWFLT